VYHAKLTAKAATRSLVVADLPFMSYQAEIPEAIRNAGRLVKEAGVEAVKLEGGERSEATIAAVVRAGIPVMGHVGLTPQSVRMSGGFRVQRDEDDLLADAAAVERGGAFAVVLEAVPASLAKKVTAAISIPTIGIGAGPDCDGQVLVWTDALGLTVDFQAKFVKRFAELHAAAKAGAEAYCQEVRSRRYPGPEHSYD
jgi:3-methyl-2-oxobutanoate hydroxymethyltransferase